MEGYGGTSISSALWPSEDSSAGFNDTTLLPLPTVRAEWLVILDHTSAILMTCNTITLMLAMGAATYWREVWHHVKRPWGTLVGMVCQFAFLPALGFGLCVGFHLPPYQAIGVLILACSPSGAFSTFFTYWVNGDLALSILMTAVSSLLAFGMMPLNLWAYSRQWTNQEIKVPYVNVLISLAFVTVPVIVGMIIRHFNRKWANYISKVCGLLGWVGAVTCGIMLILMYWNVIIKTSINLLITAALVPIVSVVGAYTVSKLVCFNHELCRTIAIETGCQNMVVATNVMLLSFADPQIRGQMVIFPVLYGLCQLAEVLLTVGLYQLWSYLHRDIVIEEEVKSVIDNSILTSVPVPAHRLSDARIQRMTGFAGTPDICRLQKERSHLQEQQELSTYYRYSGTSRMHAEEEEALQRRHSSSTQQCPPTLYADEVDDPNTWRRSLAKLPEVRPETQPEEGLESPYPFYGRPRSPTVFNFPQSPYFDTPRRMRKPKGDADDDNDDEEDDRDSIDFLYDYYRTEADPQKSPTLSNKGVPNMFPVTEADFQHQPSREPSPMPYGSPVPPSRERTPRHDWDRTPLRQDWDSPSLLHSPRSPISPAPASPTSPEDSSTSFGFYHNDVRIGQAEHFSTFGRKHKK